MSPTLILILVGVGFIGFGVAYALRPAPMAALTDLTLTSPTALADFVATYGGFQIGFGVFLLACARRASWLEPGLWAAVAALAGFASLRLLAILRHRGRVRSSIWFGLGLELVGLGLGLWGIARLDGVAVCQVYRPHIAKRTFDGRIGAVGLHNAASREAEVKVYHPDGPGDGKLRRRVAPGEMLVLEGSDGARLALGNDWGIQVDRWCVATLGEAAAWAPGAP